MIIIYVTIDNDLIINRASKSDNPKFGYFSDKFTSCNAYEAEDNPSAIQLSDLVDPIDVTDKRIYLVE